MKDYNWRPDFMVAMLVIVTIICNIDRNIIAVMIEPIKNEFKVADWQLGLLSGFAFTLLYSGGSLFVARLAERYDRVTIVSAGLFLWSLFTALCGAAGSFVQLVLMRSGVGATESTQAPPSHSLIADHFEPHRRPLRLSLIATGALVGSLLALPIGGYLVQLYGWRMTFVIVGLPGMLLALFVRLMLRDRFRGQGSASRPAPTESFKTAAAEIFRDRVLRFTIFAATTAVVAKAGNLSFGVTFLVRSHGMSLAEAGILLGFIGGAASIVGNIAAGTIAGFLVKRDLRWNAWIPAISLFLTIFPSIGFLFGQERWLIITCVILSYAMSPMWMGPTFAMVQTVAPQHRRSTAAACLVTSYNILGFGLGPLLAGIVSDLTVPFAGTDSLRYGIASTLPLNLVAMVFFLLAAKNLIGRTMPVERSG
jgi:predicted MFS family arabinose efflux permease